MGRKLSAFERGWLSAAIDGEGSVCLISAKRKRGVVYIPDVSVANTDQGFINQAKDLFLKCGAKTQVEVAYRPEDGRKTCYRVRATNSSAIAVLREISGVLIIKRERSEALLSWFKERKRANLKRGRQGTVAYRAETARALRAFGKPEEAEIHLPQRR